MNHANRDLQEAYRALQARRRTGGTSIPLDAVVNLAQARSAGTSNPALLDQVLADPVARAEYYFLRDTIAASGDATRASPTKLAGFGGWMGLAAVLALVAGGAATWRYLGRSGPETPVVRDGGLAVVLHGASYSGDSLTAAWSPVPGATAYAVDVFSDDGTGIVQRSTTDTVLTFSLPGYAARLEALRWRIIASRDGEALVSSAAGRVR